MTPWKMVFLYQWFSGSMSVYQGVYGVFMFFVFSELETLSYHRVNSYSCLVVLPQAAKLSLLPRTMSFHLCAWSCGYWPSSRSTAEKEKKVIHGLQNGSKSKLESAPNQYPVEPNMGNGMYLALFGIEMPLQPLRTAIDMEAEQGQRPPEFSSLSVQI